MEQKTKIDAVPDKQDLIITREFDLPLDLLFKAYEDREIIEQWMSTKVLKLENKKYGAWEFETSDAKGNVVFKAHGVIHEFLPNKRIIRTFEMVNAHFDAQLEFLEFEKITDDTSKLTMQIVYKSVTLRDQMMKMGFAPGINMAHNILEKTLRKLKS